MNIKQAQAALPVGMVITARDNEYRVTFKIDRIIALGKCGSYNTARTIAEGIAYYATDLEDAVATAIDMNKRFTAHVGSMY
jgi:hypothetical protein